MRILTLIMFGFMLAACASSMEVASLDSETGRLPTDMKVTTVKAEPVDLDSFRARIFVPDSEFIKGQLNEIGYFERVMVMEDLEKEIVAAGLQEKIPSIEGRIGLNQAYSKWNKFLWLRLDTREEGDVRCGQFILTDPGSLDDIWIAEQVIGAGWTGTNDRNFWYPMFNALIKYIEDNSEVY